MGYVSFVNDGDGMRPSDVSRLLLGMKQRVYAVGDNIPSILPNYANDALFSSLTGPNPSTNIPALLRLQQDLETICQYYVDPSGGDPTTTYFPPAYTVATWRAAAGLNSSGFRRVVGPWDGSATPTFAYGLIQDGDIFGYWIWEDLVYGIITLKWSTNLPSTVSRTGASNNSGDFSSSSMNVSTTTCDTQMGLSAPPTSTLPGQPYLLLFYQTYVNYYFGTEYEAAGWVQRGKPFVTQTYFPVACTSWTLWCTPTCGYHTAIGGGSFLANYFEPHNYIQNQNIIQATSSHAAAGFSPSSANIASTELFPNLDYHSAGLIFLDSTPSTSRWNSGFPPNQYFNYWEEGSYYGYWDEATYQIRTIMKWQFTGGSNLGYYMLSG